MKAQRSAPRRALLVASIGAGAAAIAAATAHTNFSIAVATIAAAAALSVLRHLVNLEASR
jgi:hypothetical protein